MKSPRVSRQRIAAAFKRARERIEKQWEDYICHALKRDRTDPEAERAAICVIQQRMGLSPCGRNWFTFVLEDWLRRRGHAVPWSGSPEMREYRLRWLDALIKEFSA